MFVNLDPSVVPSIVHPGAEVAIYSVDIDALYTADIAVAPPGLDSIVTVTLIAGADEFTFHNHIATDFNAAVDYLAAFAAAVA